MFRVLGVLLAATLVFFAVLFWRARRRRALARLAALLLLPLALALAFFLPTLWGKPWSIDHLYQRIFLRSMLDHPARLTQVRLLEPYGIRGHNARLDDYSLGFVDYELERDRRWVELLKRYDRASLTDPLSLALLVEKLGRPDEERRFAYHDFPLRPVGGVHQQLADLLLKHHRLEDREALEHYVTRLRRVGPALKQLIAQLRFRARRQLIPPPSATRKCAAQVRQLIGGPVRENRFYTRLDAALRALPTLSSDARHALRSQALAALSASVYPGFAALARELDRLVAKGATDDGVWRLPDGDAYYAYALRRSTTTTLSPAQVHQLGLREVARLEREIRASLSAQEIPIEISLGDTLRQLTRQPRFRLPEGDAGRRAALARFTQIIARSREITRRFFSALPKAGVVVRPAPPHRAKGGVLAYYTLPPLDLSRPGVFNVNLASLDGLYSFGMKSLACHEAVPGHHHQRATAIEMRGRPAFRRLLKFTAYGEGWALYAEQLADEAGFFSDPYDRLGYLMMQLFRAARLVVDTGLHHARWKRARALAYLRAHSGEPLPSIENEVDRYLTMPGQATAYMVGKLLILRLRRRARDALGARFEIKAFHDVVLGGGQLPLTLLEKEVERWIAREQQKAAVEKGG